jgi:hypothetical protein
MTSIRQIVTDSYREDGILAVEEAPSAEQLTEGLRRLNSLYRSLFGNELGEPLKTINYGIAGLTNAYAKAEDLSSDVDSMYLSSNYRVILNVDSVVTLFLNPNPQAGARVSIVDNGENLATYNLTLNGNGRQIEDTASVTLSTNGVSREWFYRDDLANWVRVTDLTADDDSPLPEEFDDFLVTLLAFRLHPRYGAQTSPEMTEVLKRMKKQFKARYRQSTEENSEIGLYRLPSTRNYWQTGNNTTSFNKGNLP